MGDQLPFWSGWSFYCYDLMTAFVVIAGILMSWMVDKMVKEFFCLLTLLGLGAYGFFISLDLFVLFFSLRLR
jgi:NADH-quinone oxidoreductase subunit M